jgi:hypothetical protein
MSKSATSSNGIFNMLFMPAIKPEAVIESYGKLVDQMKELNLNWMNSVHQMVDSSWDLASQLTKCGDSAEATNVYKDWLNERRDALLADGRHLSSLCFKVYQNDVAPLVSAVTPSTFNGSGTSAGNVSAMRSAAAGD